MHHAKTLIISIVLWAQSLAAIPAFAASDSALPPSPVKNWEGVVSVLNTAAKWVYQAFFIIAVIYFLWGAFTFLQAGGDTTKVAEGKKRILYGVIAVIIALLSTGAAQLIQSSLSTAAGGN